MEIRLELDSLPKDGEYVKFQIAEEEIKSIWRMGKYKSDEKLIYVTQQIAFDIWAEVVRWELIVDDKQIISIDNFILHNDNVHIIDEEINFRRKFKFLKI